MKKEKQKINKADLLAAFLGKAKIIHGNRYDYSKVIYTTCKQPITIICNIHGEFQQTPDNHINNKSGCMHCGHSRVSKYQKSNRKKVTVKEFISRAVSIHKYTYDYSNITSIEYINSKLPIVCKTHGVFLQSGTKHLLGSKCPKCMNSKIRNGWSHTEWESSGNTSKNFDSYKVYLIKCFNATEVFYKIGKTFKTIKNRFKKYSDMPYSYEVISEIKGPSELISKLEVMFHTQNSQNKYIPNKKFNGMYECYSLIEGI